METEIKKLSGYEASEVKRMLLRSKNNPPGLEDIWMMMDMVWDELGCDNRSLSGEKIKLFYSHPVWLLNGLFIEQHELSLQIRNSVAEWIARNRAVVNTVIDYGGGFGTLARMIAEKDGTIDVDIFEPFPSSLAVKKAANFSNLHFVSSFEKRYDCIICLDVLEHVDDPLALLSGMINNVRKGGYLVFANCFYPVIKCHLPSTFHFRYTFGFFMRLMGLKALGACGNSHATVYVKISEKGPDTKIIRLLEKLSKTFFAITRLVRPKSGAFKVS